MNFHIAIIHDYFTQPELNYRIENMQNYAKMVQRRHSRDALIASFGREPFALIQKKN